MQGRKIFRALWGRVTGSVGSGFFEKKLSFPEIFNFFQFIEKRKISEICVLLNPNREAILVVNLHIF